MNVHDTRAVRIERVLREALAPEEIEIKDVSHRHARHKDRLGIEGEETHFAVKIVTDRFKGLSQIARHRQVNELLKAEFESGLHSLALTTQTPGAS
ncbi:BolA family transcriptional regulator [Candidatus Kirkpatrickella diaphorinae]|uniref:BolA family transcriptional regulator n=1 Tax=Candidatus Kirkpatrickella diaphorinae TaxID=2984322 RepID=A0ABY6GJQ2_9PROT|nr:BolA family protein [Candidatus Kirkpatrickella diaphorinae]UYH51767.1 BolA family transcriptional regulator [Candidatus Kirkpatrickella diaphorinae]